MNKYVGNIFLSFSICEGNMITRSLTASLGHFLAYGFTSRPEVILVRIAESYGIHTNDKDLREERLKSCVAFALRQSWHGKREIHEKFSEGDLNILRRFSINQKVDLVLLLDPLRRLLAFYQAYDAQCR